MEREAVSEVISPETVILDGLDRAIIGYSSHHTMEHEVLVYSYDRIVQCLMENDAWDYDTACEWVEFNVIRGLPYMGPHAPIVVYDSEATRDMLGLDITTS